MPVISKRTGRDERAALLPRSLQPLFDDRFIASWDLLEEYVARLACNILHATGLEEAFREPSTVAAAVARARLDPAVATVPARWLAATLARSGSMTQVSSEETARYWAATPVLQKDPQEILEAQARHDERCLPAYAIAALAAEQYPTVLRGEETGERALFGPEGISAWVKYFSNTNPLYAISNQVGAIAAESVFPGGGSILELGGGLGSGAHLLLEQLEQSGRAVSRYRFTEISPLFLKRAQRVLARWRTGCNLELSHLDIDLPFAQAGVAPEDHTLVYAVNVLHVAHDLAATLKEIRSSLLPGGALVISECVRAFAGVPLPVELVFNLLKSFREPQLEPAWRPNGGFLTPEQWTLALQANGFGDVEIFPDIAAVRDDYPSFAVAAIIARRA
jgi:SAM-dependent methyltransferase